MNKRSNIISTGYITKRVPVGDPIILKHSFLWWKWESVEQLRELKNIPVEVLGSNEQYCDSFDGIKTFYLVKDGSGKTYEVREDEIFLTN